jgi:hypothetical protein
MQRMRAWIRNNGTLAAALLLLALCVKAAIPAGFMVSAGHDRIVTVSICADATGGQRQMQMVIPGKDEGGSQSEAAKMDGQCAFSSLAQAGLGGGYAFLLALAFALMLVLGLRPIRPQYLAQSAYVRPPLRGPPAAV